ncbi:NCS1 nucleoside transporter [Komagataeibacter xylinus E25]|nr:NCS1 nucleoside transporter [Komagataeibacter xylinus E25]
MMAAAGAVLLTPWNLYARPELIHLTLDVLATFIGPLIAILLADYYIVRRGVMDVDALYCGKATLPYWYRMGINPVAMVATVMSVAVGNMVVLVPAFAAIRNLSLFVCGGCATMLHGMFMRRAAPRLIAMPAHK